MKINSCILLIRVIFKASAINFKEWVTVNADCGTKNYDITYNVSNFQQKWALSTYAKLAETVIKGPHKKLQFGKSHCFVQSYLCIEVAKAYSKSDKKQYG